MDSKTTNVGRARISQVCEQVLPNSNNNTNLVVRPHRRHTESSSPNTAHTKEQNQEIKRSHSLTVTTTTTTTPRHPNLLHHHHQHNHHTSPNKSPLPISITTFNNDKINASPNFFSSSTSDDSQQQPKRPLCCAPSATTSIPLLEFPSEIIFAISDHLPTQMLARLSSTSCDLFHLLTPSLTTRASKTFLPHGDTVLHWAAARGYAALVLRLLNRGNIDPAAKDDHGVTPMIQALTHTTSLTPYSFSTSTFSGQSTLDCLRHILDAGVVPRTEDLSMAVKSGSTVAVQWMLDEPSLSIHIRDDDGEGVMHWVSECQERSPEPSERSESASARMGQFLIERGADIDRVCKRGMSPMVKARGMANIGVVGLLVDLKGLKARVPQIDRLKHWD